MNQYLKEFIDNHFNEPSKALDLGAGDFSDVNFLKKIGWECEGVDIKVGVDLEKPYLSENKPFDLVYSNYLIHKLKNKKQLIQTAYNNLKEGGWFFIHTFDQSDTTIRYSINSNFLKKLLKDQGFKKITMKVLDYYDKEDKHNHWHRILEVTSQK